MRLVSRSLALALALAACAAPTSPAADSPAPPSEDALDARVARVLDEELTRTVAEARVRSALAVAVDPRTGRVIAMQSLERGGTFDPELPGRVVRRHGSTVKPLTIAAALDAGVVGAGDRFEGGERAVAGATVRDHAAHGAMTLGDVMAFSSNVGTAQVFERLGRDRLLAAFARYGLAHRVGDAARADDGEAARLAYGATLEATPLEVASALAAIANGGVRHAPWRRGEEPTRAERVISADAAAATMALLEGAVARDDATGRRARVPGHRVAGKTGTVPLGDGAIHGAFVGAIPADAPRFVVLVGVVAEGDDYGGGTLAAPAFARIAARLLAAE